MINIQQIATKKGTDNTAVGNVNINYKGGSGVATGIEGHYLWGHYFDATQDIDGDLVGVGNIKGSGSINMDGNIHAGGNITADGDIYANNANIAGNVTTNNVTTQTVNADYAYTGNIVNQNNITTHSIDAIQATLQNLIAGRITVDNLTVTKAAHFFKLIIDEIKSTNGMFILSVGNTDLDHVGHINETTYRCFYKATDGSDKIYQLFEVDDQVVCQTFNVAEGVSYDVSNKFYWMKAISTGSDDVVPFASDSVETLMVEYFDADDDGLISATEFSGITSVSDYFATRNATGSFNELQYMSGITSIGNGAFLGTGLSEISLPESVTYIGANAFKNASNLYLINLPTQYTILEDSVFENCSQLSEIILLRGTIGFNCFKGCRKLTYLQLPSGMIHLTEAHLAGCDSLETLVIPDTVSIINAEAIAGQRGLQRLYIKSTTPPTISGGTTLNITSPYIQHVYIPSGSTSAYTNDIAWKLVEVEEYNYEEMGYREQQDVYSITEKYHYVDLTTTDKDSDSNGVPETGDSIAVLGNRTDTDRQAAIILSAYNSGYLDSGVTAPFIAQYSGIDDYNLSSHRDNVISKSKNEFYGQFTVIVQGQEIPLDEYIRDNTTPQMEIVTDSNQVTLFTDKDGYITSLQDAQGLPTYIRVRVGNEYVKIFDWQSGSTITYNGNTATPLR